MKILFTTIMLVLLSDCGIAQKNTAQGAVDTPFYVGTYTREESKGIYKYLLRNDGTLNKIGLVAQTDDPSFLAKSPDDKFIIAVNEKGEEDGGGTVESYVINSDSLSLINRSSSGGAYPCFVTINKLGFVVTTNYGNGTVGLLKLNKKGELSDILDVKQHTGSGATERQKGPHAHSAWFVGDDTQIISVDLGTNELWFSRIDDAKDVFVTLHPEKLEMPQGAGPRHMTIHPNGKWAYVINELSSTVTLIKKTGLETYVIDTSISTLPKDYIEQNSCADIRIAPDGKFVYATNRGHDSIVVYKVNPTEGTLALVGHESTRGKTPRNFSLSPDGDFLLVANQKTNTLVSFKRNALHGTLEYVDEIDAPTPVCILF